MWNNKVNEVIPAYHPRLTKARVSRRVFAKRLLTPTALQESARDGLFITGVRRIGKTTFLQQDLIPALKKKGALVIYADLWDNREHMSPTQTIKLFCLSYKLLLATFPLL